MRRTVRRLAGAALALAIVSPSFAGPPAGSSALSVFPAVSAGTLAAGTPLSHLGAAYGFMQKVMNGNRSSLLLINSDSTGVSAHSNGTPYWPYQVGQWLCAQQPLNTVLYSTPSGSNWGAPTTLCQGAGSGKVYIYNAAVSGTQEWYWYGSTFSTIFGPGALPIPADLVVVNHDKNHDYTEGAGALTGMKEAAVGWLSSFYPQAGVIVTEENPDPINYNFAVTALWSAGMPVTSGMIVQSGANAYSAGAAGTAGTTPPLCTSATCSDGNITWTFLGVNQYMDAKVQATVQAASLMNWEVVDNYSLFWNQLLAGNFSCMLAAGAAGSCFDYTVHQSNAMNLLMAQNFEQHLVNLSGPLTPLQTIRQIGPNLLTNGTFQTMSGGATACPDGWTCTNATAAQSTSGTPINGGSYQLKLTNTAAGQSAIAQTLGGAALNAVKGQWIHATAFIQFINTADTQSCSIQVTSNGGRNTRNYGMSAVGNYAGAVFPFSVNAFVATSDSAVTVTVFPTYNASTSAGNGCILDHVVVAPGQVPTDGR